MHVRENNQIINIPTSESDKINNGMTNNQIYVDDYESEYSDPDFEDEVEEEEEHDSFDELLHDFPAGSEYIYDCSLQEEVAIPRSTNDFYDCQTEITPKQRESAVKWILKLNFYFKLTSDSTYNAVTYLDIFLSNRKIQKKELQLYAVVCYWLAAKVDTRAQPSIEKINEATGENFTQESFNSAEDIILDVLSYQLSYPTSKFFMRFYLSIGNSTDNTILIANLFTEIALLKFEFMDFKPSIIAAASVVFSLKIESRDEDAKRILSLIPCINYLSIQKCIELIQQHVISIKSQLQFLDDIKFPIDYRSLFE